MALILAISRIELNFLTSVFTSILVGICGDNAIQFLLASRNKNISHNMEQRSSGSVVVTLIMFTAGLCFLFSYFYPVRVLGLLLSFGLLVTLMGDLWGLKLLISESNDSKLLGERLNNRISRSFEGPQI